VSAPRICVVHLVRAANGPTPLREFIDSYRRHPAGMEHELRLLLKGFDSGFPGEFADAVAAVPHARQFIADRGFDVDAYLAVARSQPADYFCFLNSFSVILSDRWLALLHDALAARDAGLAGATGSWQSVSWNYTDGVALPQAYTATYPAWKRRLLSAMPWAGPILAPLRRVLLGGMFDGFPNYHLRTNAFMVSRDTARALSVPPLRSKFAAYRFESGKHGLTRQVLDMGKAVLVVGRDGRAYPMEQWHLSNTFWRRDQENLLIADNQTRMYQALDAELRGAYSAIAWGPYGEPRLAGA
jgi:hypothetical protein